MDQYTHIAFTSRNGIQAVLDALGSSCVDGGTPGEILNSPSIRCCALGADAELLCEAGVSNVLTPKEVSCCQYDICQIAHKAGSAAVRCGKIGNSIAILFIVIYCICRQAHRVW